MAKASKFAPKVVSEARKLAVMEEIQRLDARGYSQRRIADLMTTVKMSPVSVGKYLTEIKRRYTETIIESRSEKVAKMLVQLQDIRAEAWDAYERSKQDAERFVRESVLPPEPKADKNGREVPRGNGRRGEKAEQSLTLLKEIVTTEGRLPANVYLQTVLDTLKAERELLGLDAPKQVDLQAEITTAGPSVWDVLAAVEATPPLEVVTSNDPIEAEIKAIGGGMPDTEPMETDDGDQTGNG